MSKLFTINYNFTFNQLFAPIILLMLLFFFIPTELHNITVETDGFKHEST